MYGVRIWMLIALSAMRQKRLITSFSSLYGGDAKLLYTCSTTEIDIFFYKMCLVYMEYYA